MTEETKTDREKKKEDWMNSKWRPMMGWMYMATCTADFILFPVLWSLLQAVMKIGTMTQWQPLTLQGAGLFHIAMGAVLGIAAYGRTQEKLNGANNGGVQLPANAGTTYVPPGAQNSVNLGSQPNNFGGMNNGYNTAPVAAGFNNNSSFGATPTGFGGNPGFGAGTVTTGWGGKKAPPQPDFPEI